MNRMNKVLGLFRKKKTSPQDNDQQAENQAAAASASEPPITLAELADNVFANASADGGNRPQVILDQLNNKLARLSAEDILKLDIRVVNNEAQLNQLNKQLESYRTKVATSTQANTAQTSQQGHYDSTVMHTRRDDEDDEQQKSVLSKAGAQYGPAGQAQQNVGGKQYHDFPIPAGAGAGQPVVTSTTAGARDQASPAYGFMPSVDQVGGENGNQQYNSTALIQGREKMREQQGDDQAASAQGGNEQYCSDTLLAGKRAKQQKNAEQKDANAPDDTTVKGALPITQYGSMIPKEQLKKMQAANGVASSISAVSSGNAVGHYGGMPTGAGGASTTTVGQQQQQGNDGYGFLPGGGRTKVAANFTYGNTSTTQGGAAADDDLEAIFGGGSTAAKPKSNTPATKANLSQLPVAQHAPAGSSALFGGASTSGGGAGSQYGQRPTGDRLGTFPQQQQQDDDGNRYGQVPGEMDKWKKQQPK